MFKTFINRLCENYVDNVTDFDALKKEACELVCIWVNIYWFFGPEAQLILVPIVGRILGLQFDSFYVATICHGTAFIFGAQVVIKLIILCIDYIIGWHLKKVGQ